MFPDKCCLWNEKPKTILPFLKLTLLPEKFFKYQITSGAEYLQCVRAIEVIKNYLTPQGIRDFIDVDIFFWYIYNNLIPKESKKEKPPKIVPTSKIAIDSHEAAEYYLLELGKMLGFLPYTVDQSKTFGSKTLGEVAVMLNIPSFAGEGIMKTVKEIDVIWFDQDENPRMCFEVEHTTDIVHGLERLIQLQNVYAKFFIVAPEEKRPKFEDLTTHRYPYRRLRDRFKFISYDELAQFYEATVPFYESKTRLFGE
jgi:hypothetical protein